MRMVEGRYADLAKMGRPKAEKPKSSKISIRFTDEEFDMEIEFKKPFDLSDVENVIVMVSFNVQALFNPAQGGIDITSAQDKNGNGIIEIHEDDPDGNKNLADKIEDRLDDIIEAFEDDDDD